MVACSSLVKPMLRALPWHRSSRPSPCKVPLCKGLAKSVKVSSLRASFVPTLLFAPAPGSSRFFLLSASLPLPSRSLHLPESVFGPSHPSHLIPPLHAGSKVSGAPSPSPLPRQKIPATRHVVTFLGLPPGVEKRHPPAGECPATNLLLILIQLLLAFGVGFGAIPN
jgi:hypothetical protein